MALLHKEIWIEILFSSFLRYTCEKFLATHIHSCCQDWNHFIIINIWIINIPILFLHILPVEYSLNSTFRITVPIGTRHQTMDHLHRTEHLMCWECICFSLKFHCPSKLKYVFPTLTSRRSSTSPALWSHAPAIAYVTFKILI